MENNLMKRAGLMLFVSIQLMGIYSCDKKNNDPNDPIAPPSEKGFYVVCEGNFNWGNASISNYNENNGVLTNDYFELVNNFTLGDVAQSIFETDNEYLIVVNNSSKIEVVNKSDFTSLITITGLGSPRYCQSINDSIAYVSDILNNAISIVNFKTGNIDGNIPVAGWSEQMVKHADSVYVSLYDSQSIAIINSLTNSIVGEIALDLPPSIIRLDKNGKLWVTASEWGGVSKLYRIDTSTRTIENEWEFTPDNSLYQIALPENGNYIYLATSIGEIYKFSIMGSFIIAPIFTANLNSLYCMNVNEEGEIYLGDAMDYVQNGTISKYNESGSMLYSITSGINPNTIIFR